MKLKKMPLWHYLLSSGIIVLGIILDQLTKLLSVQYLKPLATVPIISDVIHLTYVENRGAAFGMLADKRYIFMIVSVALIAALSFYLYSGICQGKLYTVATAMVISGGIGNMIDRIALGYVVDFIDFRLIDFAVFNGADSFVCVGAGLLILALVLDIINEKKARKDEPCGK